MLRVSGPRALEICESVFLPASGKKLSQLPARTAVWGAIMERDIKGEARSIDDGIATVFRAPASFTGEDTVELCCHGGVLLTETVLCAVLAAGARGAEAGEFTRRAFLNGKLGLSSAEALGNLLEAQTRAQLTLAHAGMRGKVEAACRAIYERLRAVLASIYVKIDYPDEDLAEMSDGEILAAFDACILDIERLVATYRAGHAVAEGIPTVICGRPNVGKSSLYNRIVGHEAAIVTEIEGTTRDVLSETASLGGVTLRLYDTAGLHETSDPVERIGVARAKEAMQSAELMLAVFDVGQAPTEEDLALLETLANGTVPVIGVLNKADAGETYAAFYRERLAHTVSLSAKSGEGMEALARMTADLFLDGALDLGNDAILANARQKGAAEAALAALRRAKEGLEMGLPADLYCADAECAMESLAALDGRAVSEDIVAEIFSHFCVGK